MTTHKEAGPMNMIEKVAKALHKADVGCLGASWEDLARAAIEAMREPTEEMVKASQNAEISHLWRKEGEGITPESAADVWLEMISAALKEE